MGDGGGGVGVAAAVGKTIGRDVEHAHDERGTMGVAEPEVEVGGGHAANTLGRLHVDFPFEYQMGGGVGVKHSDDVEV